jgi:large subunit ribosomal protein L24
LICPKCGRPTRVGHSLDKNGKKMRTCKKSDCLAQFE